MAIKTRVVVSPSEEHPYKVLIDRGEQGRSEHPVATVKEGEALIRMILSREPAPPEPRPWNAPDRWTANVLQTAYVPPAELEPDLMRLLADAEAALANHRGEAESRG